MKTLKQYAIITAEVAIEFIGQEVMDRMNKEELKWCPLCDCRFQWFDGHRYKKTAKSVIVYRCPNEPATNTEWEPRI